MMLPDSTQSPVIVLSTLNAKYIHASLGLRYLLANIARHGREDLQEKTVLREFTISQHTTEIVNALLSTFTAEGSEAPKIIGFGVYIWNVIQTTEVVRQIKAQRPDIIVILGGPEISHELDQQEIIKLADYVITGWGDVSFPRLCRELILGLAPANEIIQGEQPTLGQIVFPYRQYTDEDLAHRLLYVEASRGCPFKCEFCLSALDKTAWAFDLDSFLDELDSLYKRGARNFKFVDRTFNLKIDASIQILQFFLERLTPDLFIHFEIIPDHLPDRLKTILIKFPPGVLQFEIGIQSFDVDVQKRISRQQDNGKTIENLRWLLSLSSIHLHTDLIFGLPGETLESMAKGFNQLYALGPHEIQLGALKRLRGTPITRHTLDFSMEYDSRPPYAIHQTSTMSAATIQRLVHFSRNWERVANSGRFKKSLSLLLDSDEPNKSQTGTPSQEQADISAFHRFLNFSDWLWTSFEKTCGKTSGIHPEDMVDALFDYLTRKNQLDELRVRQALLDDYLSSGARGRPECLRENLSRRPAPVTKPARRLAQRQARHSRL